MEVSALEGLFCCNLPNPSISVDIWCIDYLYEDVDVFMKLCLLVKRSVSNAYPSEEIDLEGRPSYAFPSLLKSPRSNSSLCSAYWTLCD